MQSEKEDQEIAEACRRLIKNAAVCWNYLYLSQELATEKNEKRRAELIEAIRNGSVATWKHFNLHGEFDFSDERMVDSMWLGSPQKSRLEIGLKLGSSKSVQRHASYGVKINPMGLWCRLFKCTQNVEHCNLKQRIGFHR